MPLFLQLIDGYAHYRVGGVNNTFKFDYLPVNDGKWHYLEVRWPKLGEIILVMDYGHWQVRLLNNLVTFTTINSKNKKEILISFSSFLCIGSNAAALIYLIAV